MPHILKNNILEVHLDLPLEGYNFSRFDWTGKITKVSYQGIPMTTIERTDNIDRDLFGKGLYNEFGIESAIGFDEIQPGEWFHKIGIGALKKVEGPYQFTTPYEIRPAKFNVQPFEEMLQITCVSDTLNGYAYILSKEFCLEQNGLLINYQLENTGDKSIVTDEYVHNFMGIDQALIGKDYTLHLPFQLREQEFAMLVNPEDKVELGTVETTFNGTPKEQFFISHLNGSKKVPAIWELQHLKSRTGIRESGSFNTQKVNLWGWEHVISPELFYQISLKPGETSNWSRTYECFEIE